MASFICGGGGGHLALSFWVSVYFCRDDIFKLLVFTGGDLRGFGNESSGSPIRCKGWIPAIQQVKGIVVEKDAEPRFIRWKPKPSPPFFAGGGGSQRETFLKLLGGVPHLESNSLRFAIPGSRTRWSLKAAARQQASQRAAEGGGVLRWFLRGLRTCIWDLYIYICAQYIYIYTHINKVHTPPPAKSSFSRNMSFRPASPFVCEVRWEETVDLQQDPLQAVPNF